MPVRKPRLATCLLAASLALGGCITEQGMLRVAATRPLDVNLSDVILTDLPEREAVGRDTRIGSVLGVPLFDGPRLERAVANALSESGGDVMRSARVRSIDYWFLVGWSTLEVRGWAVDLDPETQR